MSAQPWFKFFPADWRSDSALRMCSPTARCLWIEMLCLMAEADPVGHLLVKGKPLSDRTLALLAGMAPEEVVEALADLEENEVFSRTSTGVPYSRKMVRDGDRSNKNTERGVAGAITKWGGSALEPRGRHLRSQRLSEARKKATHTPDQWQALQAFCGPVCLRCGVPGKLVKDHIVPIYQGGSDGIENIQPLCNRCNNSKGPETTDFRPDGWKSALETPEKRLQMPAKRLTQKPEARSQSLFSEEEESSSARGDLAIDDPDAMAWKLAIQILTQAGSMKQPAARSFFGRLLGTNGIAAKDLLPALGMAVANQTQDPKAYLTKAAQGVRGRKAPEPAKQVDWC